MPLIICSECGDHVSSKALTCPGCGAPVHVKPMCATEGQPNLPPPRGRGNFREPVSHEEFSRKTWWLLLLTIAGGVVIVLVLSWSATPIPSDALESYAKKDVDVVLTALPRTILVPVGEQSSIASLPSQHTRSYWDALGSIEQAYKSLPLPDDSLIGEQKHDEFIASCERYAESIDGFAEKLRALPVADVDAEMVAYSLSLASSYQHWAAFARRMGQFRSELKDYRSKIIGPAAFMRGLLRPDKALNDIFGDGPDELRKKALVLTEQQNTIAVERGRVTEMRASLRVLLTKRYGFEFR
jgi:hypothetical protein